MSDDFANLLDMDEVERKNTLPEWDQPIPDHAIHAATAILTAPKRIKVRDAAHAVSTKSLLKAAFSKVAPDKQLHFKDRYNAETGAVEAVTVTAGARRGRKAKNAE